MNVYSVDGGERQFIGTDYYDNDVLYNAPTLRHVYAESRGQARLRFINWWNWQSELKADLVWTDKISIRILKKSVEHEQCDDVLLPCDFQNKGA